MMGKRHSIQTERSRAWAKSGVERNISKNTLALSLKKQASYKRNKMNMHQ